LKTPILFIAAFLFAATLPSVSAAVDHNNVDAGRPLDFDDADVIAYRERAWEGGGIISLPEGEKATYGLGFEALYGFALNSHLSIGIDPEWQLDDDGDDRKFNGGDLELGAMHNFNREYLRVPAFALRADMTFPTGRDSQGTDVRLRGITSKTITQYTRAHLNLDGTIVGEPSSGERAFIPAALLGLSRPIGYPRHFATTAVAQLGITGNQQKDADPMLSAGLGLRRQVSVRSVVDVGIKTKFTDDDGDNRRDVEFITGYSISF